MVVKITHCRLLAAKQEAWSTGHLLFPARYWSNEGARCECVCENVRVCVRGQWMWSRQRPSVMNLSLPFPNPRWLSSHAVLLGLVPDNLTLLTFWKKQTATNYKLLVWMPLWVASVQEVYFSVAFWTLACKRKKHNYHVQNFHFLTSNLPFGVSLQICKNIWFLLFFFIKCGFQVTMTSMHQQMSCKSSWSFKKLLWSQYICTCMYILSCGQSCPTFACLLVNSLLEW